jgi:hypothetical protein
MAASRATGLNPVTNTRLPAAGFRRAFLFAGNQAVNQDQQARCGVFAILPSHWPYRAMRKRSSMARPQGAHVPWPAARPQSISPRSAGNRFDHRPNCRHK